MNHNEFNALDHGLRSTPGKKNPGLGIKAGTDASAIHGRPGAQVALLQSPTLPAAKEIYAGNRNVPGLPVDKPHTRFLESKPRFIGVFDGLPRENSQKNLPVSKVGLAKSEDFAGLRDSGMPHSPA
jgi:hypothetical protein